MDREKSAWLRQQLLDYFDEAPVDDVGKITMLSFAREMQAQPTSPAQAVRSMESARALSARSLPRYLRARPRRDGVRRQDTPSRQWAPSLGRRSGAARIQRLRLREKKTEFDHS